MKKWKLLASQELTESKAKGLIHQERSIFLVRKNHFVFGYQNSCPHIGVELNWLPDQFIDEDSELIHCATHGALFLVESGECIYGPCEGKFLCPVNILEENGSIFLIQAQE